MHHLLIWSLSFLCTVWQIVPGSTYIFTALVTNMMDLSSISVNTLVTRSHDLKPISVQLKLMSRRHPDPQRPLKMVAVVTPSACSGIDMQEVHSIIFWHCGMSVWCFGELYLYLSECDDITKNAASLFSDRQADVVILQTHPLLFFSDRQVFM